MGRMPPEERLASERRRLLVRVEHWLETPMLVLAGAWLVLTVLELTRGVSPLLARVQQVIWAAFVADFAFRLAIAPDRSRYLGRNWLTLVSLALPALRMVRVVRFARALRAARAVRAVRLVKVVGSVNRGMRALGRTLQRRGFAYVAAATLVVTFAGAAGMAAFESHPGGLESYGEALWWTAMLMTTVGSDYWPVSAEGRLLAFLIALFAFTVFGYITATLASLFVGGDVARVGAETAASGEVGELRAEVAALAAELRERGRRAGGGRGPG